MCREIHFLPVMLAPLPATFTVTIVVVDGAQQCAEVEQCGCLLVPLRGVMRARKPTACTAAAIALDQARYQAAVCWLLVQLRGRMRAPQPTACTTAATALDHTRRRAEAGA
jgi:hypothetical protein